MTPQERKSLAEQINANPITHIILAEIEQNAVERLIYATTEIERVEAQAGVRAARSFRDAVEIAILTKT